MKNIEIMVFTLYLLLVLVVFLSVSNTVLSLIMASIVCVISYSVYKTYLNVKDRMRYGKMTQNIHVIGLHPYENWKFEVEQDNLLDLIIFVPHSDTYKEVKRQKQKLIKSGNVHYKHYDKMPLSDYRFIRVTRYNFRKGENFNESWEDYQCACLDDIKYQAKLHNKAMCSYDTEYYELYSLGLSGIQWQLKTPIP